jgi:hypothetical protein
MLAMVGPKNRHISTLWQIMVQIKDFAAAAFKEVLQLNSTLFAPAHPE